MLLTEYISAASSTTQQEDCKQQFVYSCPHTAAYSANREAETMENGSFHNRLLSVMEVLAKAAVAEINRCVDDGCAVLRLEVSQSRRDIDLLRRKCELMEAELRRNRMRARRKVFYPPAAERFSPLVRVVLSKDRQSPGWDLQMNAEASNHPQQQHAADAEHTPVKNKCEEDVWQNGSEEKLNEQLPCFSPPTQTDSSVEGRRSAENPATPGSLDSTAEAVPEQQLNRNQIEAELVVKREIEEESDERTATFDSVHKFVTEGSDRQLWPANLCTDAIDPSFSYLGQQFEGIPSLFQSQSGHQGKSHSVVVSDKQSRTLSDNRLSPDEGYNALDQCLIPGQSQHQISDSVPPTKAHSENFPMPNTVATSFCPQGRSSYSLVRRMRAPWRSGIGEKRFSCTYCDKSFTRFSQLKEHLRSHTGEKPFSCLQCGRSFTKHCNLIRHAVVHSGEKPYGCSQCGKCFTQRSSLKSHQKTAH